MLPKSESAIDAQSLISFMEKSGIIPNRCMNLDPIMGPSCVNIECNSDDFRVAFLEYTRKFGEISLRNFENFRLGGPFDDQNSYIESMTDEGRVSLIDVNEPRYGAYVTREYEKIGFYYALDFDLLEKEFSESVDFEFSEFIYFMNEWSEFWNEKDPTMDINKMAEYDKHFDFENSVIFTEFANDIFSLFKDKMKSFNREWICIKSSQSPFHFSLNKGIYSIVFTSKSNDCKSWDFVEFVCDY